MSRYGAFAARIQGRPAESADMDTLMDFARSVDQPLLDTQRHDLLAA